MKAIILSLITSCLLLIGCGGGGGGGGSSGGGGPSLPDKVELSISPFAGGLSIRWHNLPAIERAGGIYIHLNLTSGNPPQLDRRRIAIEDFSDDSNDVDGLIDGTAYRLVEVRVELPGNISRVIDNITWSEPWQTKTNAEDQEGNGIVVGTNYDGDGRADSVDTDDDNDMVLDEDEIEPRCVLDKDCDGDGTPDNEDTDYDNDGVDDSEDACPAGLRGWESDRTNDIDNDGCHDRDEDVDDDGDGLIEIGTAAELDAVRWVLDGTGFKANEGAMLNQSGCGNGADISVCSGYELVRNISLTDYIAANYPTEGWQPIAPDGRIGDSDVGCIGDAFVAIFDGNGFEITGLWIDRPQQDCVGLFGQAEEARIMNLGVVADRVIGEHNVGVLVGGSGGTSRSSEIIQSYAVSSMVSGISKVGGLVGVGDVAVIIQSYAVSNETGGRLPSQSDSIGSVGGLIGKGNFAKIIQSYAVSGSVKGSSSAIGGLVGFGQLATIIQSYAVSGPISRSSSTGGLVGSGTGTTATASYWDTDTSGETNDGATGSSGEITSALRSPTDYGDTGIYSTWNEGAMVDGININTTIWCDEDASGEIEMDEMRDSGDEDNRIWDFGTASDYPALRCTGDSLTDQRAWWHLNATGQPELN